MKIGTILKAFLIIFLVVAAGLGGAFITLGHPFWYLLWVISAGVAGFIGGHCDIRI